MVGLPQLLFPHIRALPTPEKVLFGAALSTVTVSLVGYALVAVHLYEFASLAACMLGLMLWVNGIKASSVLEGGIAWLLDSAEGYRGWRAAGRASLRCVTTKLRHLPATLNATTALRRAPMWLVAASSGWIRLAESLTHWAPSLSDSYVTMAWITYVEQQELFSAGLYPAGTHIVLSAIRKLSACPGVFAVKYVGPLNGLLIVGSVYLAVWLFTHSRGGAVLGAGLYGLFGSLLERGEAARQASTNAQEFGLIFVLSSIAFASDYLRHGHRSSMYACAVSLGATYVLHPMPALFASVGLATVMAVQAVLRTTTRERLLEQVKGCAVVGGLCLAPLVVGYLAVGGLHSSSQSFALAGATTSGPVTEWLALGVAASTLAVTISLLLNRSLLCEGLSSLLLSAVALAIYQAPRLGLHSEALALRGVEFVALTVALAVGCCAGVIGSIWPRSGRADGAWGMWVSVGILGTLLVCFPQRTYSTYRMEYDGSAKAMVRIYHTLRRHQWTIIAGREGYDWAVGVGHHIHSSTFVSRFPPRWPLTASVKPLPRALDSSLLEADSSVPAGWTLEEQGGILLFVEKRRFKYIVGVDEFSAQEATSRRAAVQSGLKRWVSQYAQWCRGRGADPSAPRLRTFYEDDDVVVYELPPSAQESGRG